MRDTREYTEADLKRAGQHIMQLWRDGYADESNEAVEAAEHYKDVQEAIIEARRLSC